MKKYWRTIINSGIRLDDSPEIKKIVRIVNHACISGTIVLLVYVFINLAKGYLFLSLINLFFALVILACYFANVFQLRSLRNVLMFTGFPLAVFSFSYFIGNIGSENYLLLLLILSFYILNNSWSIALSAVFTISLFLSAKYILSVKEFDPIYLPLHGQYFYPNLIITCILIILASRLFKYDTLHYQKRISKQNELLEQKIKELDHKHEFSKKLLKELNHRVKNNLQLISSLFILQRYNTSNQSVQMALDDARKRIDTVAILHQKLYKEGAVLESDLSEYINELVNFGIDFSSSEESTVEVDVEQLYLPIEYNVHVGLMVNELLTNAVKYGKSENSLNNHIKVKIQKKANRLKICVSDSGAGFPKDVTTNNNDSFGLGLVDAICKQHAGSLSLNNRNGAVASIDIAV